MSRDLEHELDLAKKAREEWIAKWRHAESRINAVWNDAIHTARMRLGHHEPKCFDRCMQCWFYDESLTMMRGDPNNYVPVKERMKNAVADLKSRIVLPPKEKKAYLRALDELSFSVEKMLSDRE